MFDNLRKEFPNIQSWSDDRINGHIARKYGIKGAAMMQPDALMARILEARGEKPPEKPDRSLMGSIAAGIEDRTYAVGQGGLDAIGIAAKSLGVDDALGGVALHDYSKAKSIPDTYFMGLPINLYGPEAWKKAKQSGVVKEADVAANKSLTESRKKVGYKPYVSWDQVKQDPSAGNIGAFILESALVSLPDMAALLSGPLGMGTYVTARSGEIAKERARRDGDREPTGEDLVKAIPTSVLIAALDRVGLTGMLGISKGASRKAVMEALKGGGKKSAAQFGKQVGIAGAKEAGTEAAQELAEYATTTLGTKTPWDTSELTDRLAQAAVVGGPFGATVRGVTAGTTVGKGIHARAQSPKQVERAIDGLHTAQGLVQDFTSVSPDGPSLRDSRDLTGPVRRAVNKTAATAQKGFDAIVDPLAKLLEAPADYFNKLTGWDKTADKAIGGLRKAFNAATGSNPLGEGLVDPYANLTDESRDAFKDVKAEGLGVLAQIEQSVQPVFQVLWNAPDRIKAQTQAYLTSPNADPSSISDAKYRDLAVGLKQTIDQIGRGLVESGWMPHESYLKYRDQYLPRLYLKHLEGIGGKGFVSRDHVKARDESIPEDVRKTILGEIDDPAVTASVALGAPLRAFAREQMAQRISENPDWAWKPGEVEVAGANTQVVLKQHRMALSNLLETPGLPENLRDQLSALVAQVDQVPVESDYLNSPAGQQYWTRYQKMLRQFANGVEYGGLAHSLAKEADRIGWLLNRTMTTDAAQAEAKDLLQRSTKADPEVGAEMLRRAQHYIAQTIEVEGEAPKDLKRWKKLPDKAEWGDLRGMYVKRDIYNQLVGNFDIMLDESYLKDFGDWMKKAVSMWKVGKVALNPPTVSRNILSNTILLNMSGVPLAVLPARLEQAMAAMVNKNKFYKEAVELGLPQTNLAANELVKVRREFDKYRRSQADAWKKIGHSSTSFLSRVSELYGGIENTFKLASYIDSRKRGLSPKGAMRKAQSALFDYSEVSRTVNFLRRYPVGLPFVTFQTKVAGKIAETMIRRPLFSAMWGTSVYYGMGGALQAALSGLDEEDYSTLKAAASRYIAENPSAFILPHKDESGRWVFVDLGYILPWGWAVNVAQKAGEGKILESMGEAGFLPTAPLAGLIAATTGVDPFTKRKIDDWLTHIWNLAAPTIVTEHSAVGKIWDAHHGYGGRYGSEPPRSPSQAWAGLGGVNLYPQRPEESRIWAMNAMKSEISDIRRQMTMRIREIRNTFANVDPAKAQRLTSAARLEYGRKLREAFAQLRKYQEQTRLPEQLHTDEYSRDARKKRMQVRRWMRRERYRFPNREGDALQMSR